MLRVVWYCLFLFITLRCFHNTETSENAQKEKKYTFIYYLALRHAIDVWTFVQFILTLFILKSSFEYDNSVNGLLY